MKTYALDTNCFIDAVNPGSQSYRVMKRILSAFDSGKVLLNVSLQTLHELEQKKDAAWELAKTLPELPHWPIGTWDEQVGTWAQQTGTWDDGKRNDKIQLEIKALAKPGTDIRDRGGYIDALRSQLDGFVTSDKQVIAIGPSKRINERFFTKVLTPEQLADELGV
jgi:predicted nucleic acid-binding protein